MRFRRENVLVKSVILNPPYNMRWNHPELAGFMPRYIGCVPPESNANYAFVLSALEWCEERAVILLPNGVLTTDNRAEKEIRKMLIESNLVSAVIMLPDSMFVSTTIPTCILVFDKNKDTASVEMIDMRKEYVEEIRDQRGQVGSNAHTNRTYHKTFKVLTDEHISKAINAINQRQNIEGYCASASISQIRKEDYILTPSRYIEHPEAVTKHRPFADIAEDYNRIIKEKNRIKLTLNETVARRLGIPVELYGKSADINSSFKMVGCTAETENYMHFTKSALIRIEIDTHQGLPYEIMDFLKAWSLNERKLNDRANVYLAEFRDAILPDLMNGKIDLEGK